MSDLLNQRHQLRIQVNEGGGAWESIERDVVLLVAPPASPTHPQRRLHRLRHRVAIEIADYRVVGTAHVPPGTHVDQAILARRSAFLPVTEAAVRSAVRDYAVDLPWCSST